ncbi:hypothetical protein [Brevibacterium yomogidense]|uniref:Uncharacterized protein n=1 Tax=Brevibacterium yomogidense TaxID=946573 RepID=A0A1X6WUJ8_9MICO|nr:hypothetical protein [Brevibacterium yomogidense]SLM88733.1 hypothetical protein FM105_00875 [Brevibacterium yomogidense]
MTDTGEDPMDAAHSDDPTLAEPTPGEIRDAAAEAGETPGIGEELADRDTADGLGVTEPGAEGPEGTGIEGADDALVDLEDDAGPIGDASGSVSDASPDLATAADQGNREGDEMLAEGDDPDAP